MRVKDAFDRLIRDLPPDGVSVERPTSTKLIVRFEMPTAEHAAQIKEEHAAYQKALRIQEHQLKEAQQLEALAEAATRKKKRLRLVGGAAVYLLLVGLPFMMFLIGHVQSEVFFSWLTGITLLASAGWRFFFPVEPPPTITTKRKPLPSIAPYQPSDYTHLVLELSPKGGDIYQYKKRKKKALLQQFKWYNVKAALPQVEGDPYVLLESKKMYNLSILEELRSAIKIEYCAHLLDALVKQRNVGTVPEDWYQPDPTLVHRPIPKPKEKIDLEPPVKEPILLVDLSEHLIDDNLR